MDKKDELSFLEKEVKQKKIEIDNLNGQLKQTHTKVEDELKRENAKIRKTLHLKEKNLDKKIVSWQSKINELDIRQKSIESREVAIDQAELQYVDLDKKHKDIIKQRSDFLKYKYEIDKEIEIALNTIAESKEVNTVLDARKYSLDSFEEKLKNDSLYWDQQTFELKEKRREFDIEKLNYEATREVEHA